MPDWDEDSPALRENLRLVLGRVREQARMREEWTLEVMRDWHRGTMRGLKLPFPEAMGNFRGEAGLEDVEVKIGRQRGVAAGKISEALAEFERKFRRVVARLDELLPTDAEIGRDELLTLLDVCGWAHSEWVRIHPFANGNGRMARLLANSIAMRYGLPPFIRLRPRPDEGYAMVCAAAMRGEWAKTAEWFGQMLDEFLTR